MGTTKMVNVCQGLKLGKESDTIHARSKLFTLSHLVHLSPTFFLLASPEEAEKTLIQLTVQ